MHESKLFSYRTSLIIVSMLQKIAKKKKLNKSNKKQKIFLKMKGHVGMSKPKMQKEDWVGTLATKLSLPLPHRV